jgi:hypothetical protein
LLESKPGIGVTFELLWSDVDVVEVRISAWTGLFGGVADVYVGKDALGEMAAVIQGFPDRPLDRREVTFGSFGADSAGGAASFQFCADKVGRAHVESRIESGSADSVQSVSLALPIEAAAVDSFVVELRRVAVQMAGRAHLNGAR